MSQSSSSSSLYVVGSGIKFFSHLTTEAITYIKQSDIVLYLVNDPILKLWIEEQNSNSESLDFLYSSTPMRAEAYNLISSYVLEHLYQNKHVCFVLYGHPAVFSKPGIEAVKIAKHNGYNARILPGISSEDCLFADLLIDPGSSGCQSFEATDFLIHQRQFDICSYLILWQIDALGIQGHESTKDKKVGITLLVEHLIKYYEDTHEIIIYEAAQYPGFEPKIIHVKLVQLHNIDLTNLSTLCVPPKKKARRNEFVLKALGLK